jgi:hypothetical protein
MLVVGQLEPTIPHTVSLEENLNAGRELDPKSQVWSPLANAFQKLDFKFLNKVDRADSSGKCQNQYFFAAKLWRFA